MDRAIRALRLVRVFGALALATLVLLPVQLVALRLRWPLAAAIPRAWHRIALAALGARVTIVGAPAPVRPCLVCANHVSWSDIVMFGAVLPASFVAKSDVAGWPGVGFLARLQRTVFVDRARRQAAGGTASEMAARLAGGDVLVLFPEGTSSEGHRVLPFRSALLGAARAEMAGEVAVQAAAIVYTGRHGVPLTRAGRAAFGWTGDTALAPHLLAIAGGGPFEVEVRFGRPRSGAELADRKALARDLEAEVRALAAAARQGRAPPAAAR
jgi:1-acyl-sn-glycerol-3-phosphate acyltransferase